MKIGFAGMTHLGQTMAEAATIRGFETVCCDMDDVQPLTDCKLILVTKDVNSPNDIWSVTLLINAVLTVISSDAVLVVVSQVSPGFTRPILKRHAQLYYQVDTIIMNCALDRMLNPEQIIVGCEEPTEQLPEIYQAYLKAFNAPILRIGIEAAEIAKLSINFLLATQVKAAQTLSGVADKYGADWQEIIPALRNDRRIGPKAYLELGVVGGHLPRDVKRICELAPSSQFAQSILES